MHRRDQLTGRGSQIPDTRSAPPVASSWSGPSGAGIGASADTDPVSRAGRPSSRAPPLEDLRNSTTPSVSAWRPASTGRSAAPRSSPSRTGARPAAARHRRPTPPSRSAGRRAETANGLGRPVTPTRSRHYYRKPTTGCHPARAPRSGPLTPRNDAPRSTARLRSTGAVAPQPPAGAVWVHGPQPNRGAAAGRGQQTRMPVRPGQHGHRVHRVVVGRQRRPDPGAGRHVPTRMLPSR